MRAELRGIAGLAYEFLEENVPISLPRDRTILFGQGREVGGKREVDVIICKFMDALAALVEASW